MGSPVQVDQASIVWEIAETHPRRTIRAVSLDPSAPLAGSTAELTAVSSLASDPAGAVGQRHEALLHAVSEVARLLVANREWMEVLPQVLATLYTATGVDRVVLNRYDPDLKGTWFVAEHKRPDLAGVPEYFGPGPWMDSDFEEVSGPLREGRVYRSLVQDRVGLNATANAAGGVLSDLIVPIMTDDGLWGCIGFDDCTIPRVWRDADVAVLQTTASALAAAITRARAEERRLLEAERHALRVQRHSHLLAAVARSAEELLAARHPATCLDAVLARIGMATRADRACIARLDWTPADARWHGWQEIVHEWTRPGLVRQMDTAARRFAMWREDRTWAEALTKLSREGGVRVVIEEAAEPFRSEQTALGVVWSLAYPILVEGGIWGVVGFDYATPVADYDTADLAALKTVASVIADALSRERSEARAIAAERDRADQLQAANVELARRDVLLTAAAEALKRLMDATTLSAEVGNALRLMGEAAGMHRVKVILQCTPPQKGAPVHELTYEWCAPELASQASLGLTRFEDASIAVYLDALRAGQSVFHSIDEVPPELREAFEQVGMQSMGVVPIFSRATYMGMVAFDDCRRRRAWSQIEKDALTIAARGLGAALQRERLEVEKIEMVTMERTAAAKGRTAELARANAAMRRTLAELATTQDTKGFFGIALKEIARVAGACSVHLFDYDAASNRLRQIGVVRDEVFFVDGHPDDPPIFREGFDADVTTAFRTMVARPAHAWKTDTIDSPTVWPDTRAWHHRMGHQTLSGRALMAGDQPIGLLGLAFRGVAELNQTQAELIEALAQQVALAMQLTRLSQRARQEEARAAVQGERNRLAREIHDTLAQSFTGILLQLEAATLLRERGDRRADERYRNIRAQAQLGLAEARRTALALSSEALDKGLLPALTQLCQRSHVEERMSCTVTHEGLPRAIGREPEECLLRLAKEALSNAVRHGRAAVVRMHLTFDDAEVRLTITDNGEGFVVELARPGLGLVSMHEGVTRLGGQLTVTSRPHEGTTLVASLPLAAAPASPKQPISAVERTC